MVYQRYSVLMSIYSKEKPAFFQESVKSMLNQTISPDQIVIVKDGPLNNDLDKMIEYFDTLYPGIFTIVQLEKNLGLGLALNEGLLKCRNELVARMDTDDISFLNRCELQLQEFEKDPDLCIVGSWTLEFYDDPNNPITYRTVPEKQKDILKYSRRRSPFNHPTVMYKCSMVLKCGGYRDIRRKEDLDLFLRMLQSGVKSMNISKALLYFRSNRDNYKRRKEWTNCLNYIKVMYHFWKTEYINIYDLIFILISQIVMYLTPIWLFKIISDNFLREKVHIKSQ